MNRCVVVLALVVASSSASAQPAGAQAEVLFREGRELMTQGKYPEACAAFDQSQKLEPAITTLINLAGCREKAGQLATAWGLFLDAERQTRSGKDAATMKLHDVAKDRAKKLEPRISKLSINVPQKSQADGLEIERDKEHVDAVMWNRALPIDGGTYTVSARLPGGNTWSTQVTVAPESDTKTVEIPDLRNLPRDLVPAETTPEVVKSSPAKPDEEDEETPEVTHSPSKAVPIAVTIGAVALLGGAGGFYLWGNSTYDDAKAETASQARRDELYDSANQKRFISAGLGAAGIAAAGVAVWLFVRSGGSDESTTAVSQRRHLVISPTGVAVMGVF